jgi:tetratricopeptide (TPR) repeat protein
VSINANRTIGILIGLILLTCQSSLAADQRARPVPLLIQKQSVEIQASWREVDAIIYDNGRLKQRLPDPYFARGDLWAAAGGHEDALRDYLTGTTLLLGGEPGLVERADALERLAADLSRLHARPKPDYPIDAEKAFHRGLAHYRAGRFVEAEGLWADAVRLSPDNAAFRAHHGLALRQLGQHLEAEREVAVVRSALGRDDDSGSERNAFYRQMARIQGPERWWLEARIRIPNADQTLVDEARQLLSRRASPKAPQVAAPLRLRSSS